jgi:single-strand DNA-binding protein
MKSQTREKENNYMSYNKCIFVGRILKDLDLRTTNSGKSFLSFAIGVQRDYKDKNAKYPESDIVNLRAWNGTAEIIAKFCTRGDVVLASGRYCVDKYEKDGVQKTINYINVESVEFLRASGANTCSGFKKFKQENITNSFDSMGEEMPSVESLDW